MCDNVSALREFMRAAVTATLLLLLQNKYTYHTHSLQYIFKIRLMIFTVAVLVSIQSVGFEFLNIIAR